MDNTSLGTILEPNQIYHSKEIITYVTYTSLHIVFVFIDFSMLEMLKGRLRSYYLMVISWRSINVIMKKLKEY